MNILHRFVFVCLVGLVLSPQKASATKFANQFVEFELPPKWQCSLDGAEWICQSLDENKKRDAIIVLAAKLKGDSDTLDGFERYLKGSRTFTAANGSSTKSDPKYTKLMDINGHTWVDSLHLESEIPSFYTRYLATIKQDIAVLVTYSIQKGKYQDYLPVFDELTKSMRVFRKSTAGINSQVANKSVFESNSNITAKALFETPTASPSATASKKPANSSDSGDLALLVLIVGGAVGALLWIRKRRGA